MKRSIYDAIYYFIANFLKIVDQKDKFSPLPIMRISFCSFVRNFFPPYKDRECRNKSGWTTVSLVDLSIQWAKAIFLAQQVAVIVLKR